MPTYVELYSGERYLTHRNTQLFACVSFFIILIGWNNFVARRWSIICVSDCADNIFDIRIYSFYKFHCADEYSGCIYEIIKFQFCADGIPGCIYRILVIQMFSYNFSNHHYLKHLCWLQVSIALMNIPAAYMK